MSSEDLARIKAELEAIKADPHTVYAELDEVDRALLEIVRIEKKHLYGLDSTSVRARRDEISAYLDTAIPDLLKSHASN
jgi:hypothetical protein